MIWPFGKKKEKEYPVDNSLFAAGHRVYFVHRGDRTYGKVSRVYKKEDDIVLYDIQVGGQCPYFRYGMKEEELHAVSPDMLF